MLTNFSEKYIGELEKIALAMSNEEEYEVEEIPEFKPTDEVSREEPEVEEQ